jgi:hypothetical protein
MVKNTAISLLLLLAAGGCGATVYPQPKPIQPTAVYVADYGIHSSLLLPNGDGRYVEYAFGDWNFAALNHCWPQDALGALLISFQSALGRRFIDLAPGETAPQPVHPSPHQVQVVYASREDVMRVVKDMDARYRRDTREVMHNPDNDMDYVKDSEHYWVANNCNHLTARCLREMGCDVRGFVVLSKFSVEPVEPEIARRPIQKPPQLANLSSARAE